MASRSIPILPESAQITAARNQWQYDGSRRPDFADPVGPGEESVWDYPRPPRIEPVAETLRVFNGKQPVAETRRGVRVVETAGAPTYYFPPADVEAQLISPGELSSICEWKGVSQALDVAGVENAAWRYVRMFEAFAELFEWVSFYPSKLLCFVGTEQASAQPGGYYGGWVTRNLKGPIKGTAGSAGW